jgi:hypothetical protein
LEDVADWAHAHSRATDHPAAAVSGTNDLAGFVNFDPSGQLIRESKSVCVT